MRPQPGQPVAAWGVEADRCNSFKTDQTNIPIMSTAYWLAILTGLSYGAQGAYSKALAGRFPSQVLAWATFFFAIPLLAAYLLWRGLPPVRWDSFLPSTITSGAINLVAWNLFFKALEAAPIYLTLPFTAFTPLFMIPIAWFLLGELPGWLGALGIVLIISGAYGLHADSASLLQPFRHLFRNRGSRLMLAVALLWSVTATVEKVAVT
ncbi:MAG: EamA family transporter, partial [Calditrichaeota bacterium]